MGLKADGIISGINTSQLVSQLGAVYGRPKVLLQNKVSMLTQRKSAYTELNSLLASVRTNLESINTVSNFRSNSVSMSDTASSYFSVTADGSALPGSYKVNVEALAVSEMQIFDMQTVSGNTLDETTDLFGTDNTVTISWDDATKASDAGFASNNTTVSLLGTDTIQEAATKLNNVAGIQSYLLFDGSKYQLVVTSEKTGTDYGFSLSMSSSAVLDTTAASTTTTAPTDAKIKVNGVEVEHSTNTFTDTVPGLTISALDASNVGGTAQDVTVSLDTDAIQKKINTFITSYNKAVDYYNARNSYNSETGAKGVFFGDGSTRTIMNKLSSTLTKRFGVDGYSTSLSDGTQYLKTANGNDLSLNALGTIGIEIDTKGKLTLNSDDFNDAVLNYQDDVEALFSNTLDSGDDPVSFSGLLRQEIKTATTSYSGTLAKVSESIDDQVTSLKKQITRWETRIASYEARLLTQFTAMEQAAGQFQSTGAFLTNYFS